MSLMHRSLCAAVALFPLLALAASPVMGDELPVQTLNLGKVQQDYGAAMADKSVEGSPLSVGGAHFDHGIGTHANSVFSMDLHGGATRFTASVGLDDDAGKPVAAVRFSVIGDGKVLWTSDVMKKGEAAQAVDVPLDGVKILTLSAAATGASIDYDHADWLSPVITYTGAAPVAIDPPPLPGNDVGILTPPAPDSPRINNAHVFGVHPGRPFLFTIAVTGQRPMTFSADGLPAGLQLDPATGRITGTAPTAGEYAVTLHAKNSLGEATGPLKIKVGDLIALTPPMGWNSWNCFAHAVSADKVRQAADAMVSSGLIDHGWTFVNIDDFWQVKPSADDATLHGPIRLADGTISPNPRFPDMKGLADYIHSKGLKAGLYSSPGPWTCGGCAGSYQHEKQDAATYAAWGFDYLKYDWCSYGSVYKKSEGLDGMKKPYKLMGDALAGGPRDLVFSLCQYGMGDVSTWGADVDGTCWRTTGDITNSWGSMWGNASKQFDAAPYCNPGHYNDPDMLIVGRIGWGHPRPTKLTQQEQYTHISLWCMMSSPLLIGCDMSQLDPFTLNLLTNDEVLAVDQDPLCKQAAPLPGVEGPVFAKPLEDGSWAVGLFNNSLLTKKISVSWSSLKLSGSGPFVVRDLWRQKNLGAFADGYSADIPPHGVALVRVIPAGAAAQ